MKSEAASKERVDELFSRVANLELMVPKVLNCCHRSVMMLDFPTIVNNL